MIHHTEPSDIGTIEIQNHRINILRINKPRMIATILPGSSNFHAVGYNERKVSKGVARLIEMLNFVNVGTFSTPTPEELTKYLMDYSAQNKRVQKAQFHVAISCKGHEMSEQQLLDFAHEYLREMGYMEEGQPILIYSHYDTENTHLHIVTSRVNPDGKKIEHDHERRKSQAVIDKILRTDRKSKVENDFEAAKQYTFNSFAQFKAIMTSMGYETYQKDDTVYIKQGGSVKMKVSSADFNTLYKYGVTDRKRARQIRGILKKYRDICANKEELKTELKKKFGIDIVFFGRKDEPFGYIVVDHNTKAVFHGARILAINELLDFSTPQERFDRIDSFIDSLFTENPKITQYDLNSKLMKQGAFIKNGTVHFNGETRQLQQFMIDALTRNNRIQWVESFHPKTEEEVNLLCRLGKGTPSDLISLVKERPGEYNSAIASLRELFDDTTITNLRSRLREEGYIVKEDEGNTFAIDFNRKIIINLTAEGFDLNRLKWQRTITPQEKKPNRKPQQSKPSIRKPHIDGGGSSSEKREWEVGSQGYDRVDDGSSLKM